MTDQKAVAARGRSLAAEEPDSLNRSGRDSALALALDEANLPTLLLALVQLTGEDRWLEPPYVPSQPKGPGDNDDGGFSKQLQSSIRREALDLISAWRAGRLEPAPAPAHEQLVAMLETSCGTSLPADCGPLLAEELGLTGREVEIERAPAAGELSVLVVGAGFSGLLAAIQLRRAGIPFTVIEKNERVGGTWFENSYPGCGVDTPTHLYSLSFAQRADWSRYFARRDELHDYLERLATDHQLERSIRFRLEVVGARWDAGSHVWCIEARDGDGEVHRLIANILITGVGFLNRPAYPRIAGLESFSGPRMHTARWRHDVELAGKRVAVIGTGASAMQLVPSIAPVAERVTVFQRSPQWGIPHPNHRRRVSAGTQLLMREVPFYLGWYRLRLVWTFGDRLHQHVQWDPDWPHAEHRSISEVNDRQRRFLTDYINTQIGDRPELLSKCVPDYPPYGKRPLLDNGWFETMTRDDVELVTEAVAEIRPHGVVTATGEEFPADVLVLATGFQALRVLAPMEIHGRSGRTLREVWGEDDARAYLGITVPDFPNMFCLLGPNTFAGHGGSGVLTIELGMRYVMEMLATMLEQRIASVECRQGVHDAYNAELDEALSQTIWAYPGMTTYYRNSRGRIVVPMPWTNIDYWHRTRGPALEDYILERR
ncbi:MAG: flavin-containing monooxygenase [Solirubrobacteraceae bacterium]